MTGDCPAPRKDSVSANRTIDAARRSLPDCKFAKGRRAVRNLKRPWTDEDDARLLAMVAEDRSRMLIAASLRRSEGSVTSRLSILRALAGKPDED